MYAFSICLLVAQHPPTLSIPCYPPLPPPPTYINTPPSGFLALLRDTLWQCMWHDADRATAAAAAATAAGAAAGASSSSSARGGGGGVGSGISGNGGFGLGQRLPSLPSVRRELCEAGGRLYCLLYERCCRRPFAPTEAFHAPGLGADRFTQVSTPRVSEPTGPHKLVYSAI